MLLLSRKVNDRITIGDNVTLVVTEVKGGVVRLGFEAPREVPIRRTETLTRRGRISRMPPTPQSTVSMCFQFTT